MSAEYDPKTSLRHFPAMPMAKYGLNPYGEPLYRVVFGPSRRYLVFGEWPDGSVCAHWKKSYPQVGSRWLLERWRSAAELEPRGKEFWNTILGPWPERGDYELVEAFLEALPTSSQVEKFITWATAGRERFSFRDKAIFGREAEAAKKQQRISLADDMLKDRMPAFGIRALGGNAHRRSFAEDAELKSAEELGLPTTPGMRTGRRAQRLIESAA